MTFLLKPRLSLADCLVIAGLLLLMPHTPWYAELAYLVLSGIAVAHLERRYDHRP